MTWTIDTKSKRRLPAKLAAGLIISGICAIGAFPESAGAQGRYNRGYHHYWTVDIIAPRQWSMARHMARHTMVRLITLRRSCTGPALA